MANEKATSDSCGTFGAFAFVSGLLVGTATTVTIKVAYQLQAVDSFGNVRPFEKPLFTTFLMFLAMTMSLPGYLCCTNSEERGKLSWRVVGLLVIPSSFDLVGTALAKVGLLYVTVSLYQLTRCTLIIITALLKGFVLKERLAKHMWLGVIINSLAMGLVSVSALLGGSAEGQKDAKLGLGFIFLSCLVQGTQYIFEEKVMSVGGAHPLALVGLEGLWGVVLMCVVVFPLAYVVPGADNGSVENVFDSLVMLSNSPAIQLVLLIFVVTVALYNVAALYVTALLSAIWHAILDNFRPIAVWGADLLLFYYITDKSFGEPWSFPGSYIQLLGMGLLFFGTAVYNGSVACLDWDEYTRIDDIQSNPVAKAVLIRTPESMSSPTLMRSPILTHVIAEHEYTAAAEPYEPLTPEKRSIAKTKFNIASLPR